MNQPKKVIPVKYFIYGMVITAMLIAGVFYFLWSKEAGEKKLLAEKGIKGEAWVLRLYEQKGTSKKNKHRTYQHFMEVAFFADTAAAKPVTKDTAVSKAKNGTDLVDKLFNKMEAETKPFGVYQTLSIPISRVAFKKYNKDDKVKIVYLKEDLNVVKLEEELY
jgi:hypothetical protein